MVRVSERNWYEASTGCGPAGEHDYSYRLLQVRQQDIAEPVYCPRSPHLYQFSSHSGPIAPPPWNSLGGRACAQSLFATALRSASGWYDPDRFPRTSDRDLRYHRDRQSPARPTAARPGVDLHSRADRYACIAIQARGTTWQHTHRSGISDDALGRRYSCLA